jgi:hypothetical protein
MARDAQGKLELALQDFEGANAIEADLTIVVQKLKEIRAKLGISPDGRIRPQVDEPRVKITAEDSVPTPKGPKIEVVEERSLRPPPRESRVTASSSHGESSRRVHCLLKESIRDVSAKHRISFLDLGVLGFEQGSPLVGCVSHR